VNSSLIESKSGSITLVSPGELNVDNKSGVIAAQNGSINVRDNSYRDSFNSVITGGDLLSQSVNVYAGNATADIFVNKLSGTINQTGLAAHVSADTDNLRLGSICLTGDPTFKNTGNISLDGDIIVAEALTIIAGGSIENSVPLTIAAGDGTTGHPITIIAGANITSGGANSPTLPPGTAVATTINGASATGGFLRLGSNGAVTINSRTTATTGNHNGGTVLLASFEGGTFGGSVDLDDALVQTGGRGSGTNGNVTIIGNSVQITTIDTTGSTAASPSGSVTLLAAQPNAGVVSWNANGTLAAGSITAGSFAGSSGVAFDGNVTAGDSITAQGAVVVAFNSILTTPANASVSLNGLTPSGVRDTIEFNSNSFISTQTLNLTSGDEISGIITNAQFINASAVSDVELTGQNPDPVVLAVNAAGSLQANFVGSVISDPTIKIVATNGIRLVSSSGSIGLSANSPLEFTTDFLGLNAIKGNVFAETTGNTALVGNLAHAAAGTYSVIAGGDLGANASTTALSRV